MSYRIFVVLAAALTAGCASTPTPADSAQPPEKVLAPEVLAAGGGPARVLVKRDSGFAGAACKHTVLIDGKPVADLFRGQAVTMYTQPGRHIIGVNVTPFLCGQSLLEAEVLASEAAPVVLRLSADINGTVRLGPTN